MFLASVWEWVLPIGLGLVVGIMITMRKKYDFSQIVFLEPEEFRLNMRKGQLIDVRREDNFNHRRINGSRSFPNRTVFSSLSRLRRDQAIFLYDENCKNSVKRIAKKLIKKGFKPVYVLKNGLEKWPFPIKEDTK
ncbi:MAG: rhodanese-like domain-containing protein [Candidatus Izemoplasmatales bacterium]|nr:rhodanese-like domain-containing protein [Candidatus Izemoplasmatales bacterium]NLF48144.1 rhodanese-like domain-containing protein [Acholeplasmataceae bacterium]MDD4354360.1 rhodanese-like domain-containing protein [Candidatus Izemoplasmatales bacterium]MDD4987691.1 rhodanese-like domain-containing protein [Candidatus Izemoplasmatales bacterium]MDD5601695.1 rhodanese-like domain-containing protein [Candidatus Izemoplasmatales bacterium]